MVSDRLDNDHSFECSNLVGKTLESFVGYYDGENEDRIDMLILKLKELDLYQRFFLDAAIGFWEEYDLETATSEYEDVNKIDLAEKYSLSGESVISIVCNGSYEEFSSFSFEIGELKLLFHYLDNNDFDSETVLEKL